MLRLVEWVDCLVDNSMARPVGDSGARRPTIWELTDLAAQSPKGGGGGTHRRERTRGREKTFSLKSCEKACVKWWWVRTHVSMRPAPTGRI